MYCWLPKANTVVAWVKCNGFQKAEAFAGIAGKGHRSAEFHSPEEWPAYQLKA